MNSDPAARLERCPIEHAPSELYSGAMLSADLSCYLRLIDQDRKLPYENTLAAMAIVDLCEACPDFPICRKKRRAKVDRASEHLSRSR
jgi:hypothetical protein